MPTYEYACRDCGNHVEVVQSFTDAPLEECPSCRGRLRKVFGAVGIAFKGSGFYKTDSRRTTTSSSSGSSSNGSGSSEAGSGSSSGSSSTTSEAKSSEAKSA